MDPIVSLDVREELIGILQSVTGQLARNEFVDWPDVYARLEVTREVAVREVAYDDGWVTSFASAVNLMTDCVRDVIDRVKVSEAVKVLDVGPGWNRALTPLVRSGPKVKVIDASSMGYSVIRWELFRTLFGPELNLTDDDDEQKYWEKIQKSSDTVPLDPVLLADPSGSRSSWVTDDRTTTTKLHAASDPTKDVYDGMGLNWSGPTKTDTTHAVLFGCALHKRERAAGSVHCPNAVDGWENLLFVSRDTTTNPWPDHGSATAGPFDDKPNFPEAIHGPTRSDPDKLSAKISAAGDVHIGNRALQCGESATARAMKRLRAAVANAK